MSDSGLLVAGPPRGGAKGWSLTLLVAVAVLAPAAVLLALAAGAWPLPALLAVATALCLWSLADIRMTFPLGVLLATFVDYKSGHLTLQLTVVCAWLAWTSLLLLWRSAWKGWACPRSGITAGLGVWLGVCAFGVVNGLLHGNNPRYLGLELAAALWPAMGLGVIQVRGGRGVAYAGLALVAIGLVHAGFGLTMLQVYRQRLGGIYFTTLTGMVAVGLWTAALLAPRWRVRWLCLLGMVPMLAHLLFSFTRGYWLGFLAGLAVATALAWRSLGRLEPAARARRLLLIPALLLVCALTLGLSILYFGKGDLPASVGRRFSASFSTEMSSETVSNIFRLAEYERAAHDALQAPVLGKGFGYAIYSRNPLDGTVHVQWYVHNYYLLTWLKLGLVGLIAFGFLIWTLIRVARRAAEEHPSWLSRAWAVAAIAVTVQVLVILLTNFSLADVSTSFVMAYVWGVLWVVAGDARTPRRAGEGAEPPPAHG